MWAKSEADHWRFSAVESQPELEISENSGYDCGSAVSERHEFPGLSPSQTAAHPGEIPTFSSTQRQHALPVA